MTDQNYILDALPYIDKHYDNEEIQRKVNLLIEEEMSRGSQSNKSNFKESDLPRAINLFEQYPILKDEFSRAERGVKLDALDNSRYHLQAPSQDLEGEIDEALARNWIEASDNSKAQLEHMENSLMNQELMEKYSANAWKLHVYKLENLDSKYRSSLENTKQSTLSLHRERKSEQLALGQKLSQLQEEWKRLINSTLQVDLAVQSLEAEIQLLQQQASHKK